MKEMGTNLVDIYEERKTGDIIPIIDSISYYLNSGAYE